jgi:hypothetical protein
MRLPRSQTSRSLRVRQGIILLVGAVVIVVAIGASPTGFYWTFAAEHTPSSSGTPVAS